MARMGMVIDMKNCIGCHSCAVACKVENNLPDGIWWNRILTEGGAYRDTPSGTYPAPDETPSLHRDMYPVACQHCEDPACVKACPVGATWKDPDTGIVRQDPTVCVGCRMCMAVCPYTGVRSFNWEEPKFVVGHAMGSVDAAPHLKGTVEKCQFCAHRVAKGELPACIEACPARIRTFGDLDDPKSDVSRLLAEHDYTTLLPEKGTKPNVYFLV